MIVGGIDTMVEAKPPPTVDPITKTVDPPVDSNRDLMGSVQSLMKMAGQAFGANTGNKNSDLAETIGNIGANVISANANKKEVPVKSKRGVRFGSQ
jgi:hypothetical protein